MDDPADKRPKLSDEQFGRMCEQARVAVAMNRPANKLFKQMQEQKMAADLAELAEAWPALPLAVRDSILALVNTHRR
jgi:hypothetical protein